MAQRERPRHNFISLLPSLRMKNDTSLAVEKFGKCTDEYVPFVVREAIAKKYLEMERILIDIRNQGSSDPNSITRVDACAALARIALTFDPLAFHE